MKKYILVIDDSPTICTIIEHSLCQAGYGVISFHDGEQAIAWQGACREAPPDLVLLDLCLPARDGFAVLRDLRALPNCRQTPIGIISRRDGLLDKLKAKLLGATLFLPKPFTLEELVETVHAYLGSATPAEALR